MSVKVKNRKDMIKDIFGKVLDEAQLSDGINGGLNRLLEDRGFPEALRRLVKLHSEKNQYIDEQEPSVYTYPETYQGPHSIEDQIKFLASELGLNSSNALEFAGKMAPLSRGAEGRFAIANPIAVAQKHFPAITDPDEQYCQATRFLLEKGILHSGDELIPSKFRLDPLTISCFEEVAQNQPGDIWIIDAQFGLGHRGESSNRTKELFRENDTAVEFGLCLFSIGCMALTHPERYSFKNKLSTIALGSEFQPEIAKGSAAFCQVPALHCNFIKKITCTMKNKSEANANFGAVTGFLPKKQK